MAKSSPEKLAQALRANLKRRKQTQAAAAKEPPSGSVKTAQRTGPAPFKSPVAAPIKTPIKSED